MQIFNKYVNHACMIHIFLKIYIARSQYEQKESLIEAILRMGSELLQFKIIVQSNDGQYARHLLSYNSHRTREKYLLRAGKVDQWVNLEGLEGKSYLLKAESDSQ